LSNIRQNLDQADRQHKQRKLYVTFRKWKQKTQQRQHLHHLLQKRLILRNDTVQKCVMRNILKGFMRIQKYRNLAITFSSQKVLRQSFSFWVHQFQRTASLRSLAEKLDRKSTLKEVFKSWRIAALTKLSGRTKMEKARSHLEKTIVKKTFLAFKMAVSIRRRLVAISALQFLRRKKELWFIIWLRRTRCQKTELGLIRQAVRIHRVHRQRFFIRKWAKAAWHAQYMHRRWQLKNKETVRSTFQHWKSALIKRQQKRRLTYGLIKLENTFNAHQLRNIIRGMAKFLHLI
jgi:hypothetical protein